MGGPPTSRANSLKKEPLSLLSWGALEGPLVGWDRLPPYPFVNLVGGHEVDVGKGVPPTMGSSRGSPNVEGDPLILRRLGEYSPFPF